jgi:hypothetical protein
MEELTINEILTLKMLLNDFLLHARIKEDSTAFIGGDVQIMIADMPDVRSILQKVQNRIDTPSMAL